MAYVVSAGDAGGTPVLSMFRTGPVEPVVPARARVAAIFSVIVFIPAPPAILTVSSPGIAEPESARAAVIRPAGPPPLYVSGSLELHAIIDLARARTWPTYTDPDGQMVAVYYAEKHQTRQIKTTNDGSTLTRVFLIHGTYDPAACEDIGPQVGDQDDVLPDYVAEERSLRPFAAGGGEADIVELTVTYSKPQQPQRSGSGTEPAFGYEFGGESEHIDKAIAQVHYGGDGVRVGDLINVTDEEVQGIDVNAPILDFTEEHVYTEAQFTPTFRRMLRDHIQKTNLGEFREWAAGEVLFIGASARKQAKRWYVTFQFRVRRNVDALVMTLYDKDGTTSTETVVKRGWQYLWIESIRLPSVVGASTRIKVVPHAAHVATVYDEVDFTVFDIGTDPLP